MRDEHTTPPASASTSRVKAMAGLAIIGGGLLLLAAAPVIGFVVLLCLVALVGLKLFAYLLPVFCVVLLLAIGRDVARARRRARAARHADGPPSLGRS